MDYNLAILHKNTVRIKFNVGLSYKQGRIYDFLGGGGRFFINFVDLFFKLTKLILWALVTHFKEPILIKLSVPQAKLWKKVKKGVFRQFLENFDLKIAFFWRALPPKNWRQRRLWKVLRLRHQKWISQESSKGETQRPPVKRIKAMTQLLNKNGL